MLADSGGKAHSLRLTSRVQSQTHLESSQVCKTYIRDSDLMKCC